MKIAVTTENDQVFQHFGQCPLFTIYDVEDGSIKSKQLLDSSRNGHSALAGLLSDSSINVVICGGIGVGAMNMLAARGIQVIPGVVGGTDAAVRAFLEGRLSPDVGPTCNHHSHDHGQTCSCHDHCS